MPMNSVEIRKYFEQKVDKAYTGYLDNFKLGRLFKDTLYKVYNEKLDNWGLQKNRDDISSLIKADQTYSINNNKIGVAPVPVASVTILSATQFQITFANEHNVATGDQVTISGVEGTLTMTTANGTFTPTVVSTTVLNITVASATGVHTANTGQLIFSKLISDYYRLLTAKADVLENSSLTIIKATNDSPIRITVNAQNNLRSGEKIVVSGVTGNTNANGTHYVRKINSKSFDLYSDAILKVPVTGNANYISGGTLTRVNSEYCKELTSDKKIAPFSAATETEPLYQTTDKFLVFHPLQNTISTVVVDYGTKPKEIVFTESGTDYTIFYNDKFLYYLIEQAAKNFGAEIRDTELYQLMSKETLENK